MHKQMVYLFSKQNTEGNADQKVILGGKGANLAEMCLMELPIPPGFTITTETCDYFQKNQGKYPEGLEEQVQTALKAVEKIMNKKLGDPVDPLLVSVRSGAAASMPGMMDTILNLGLNDESVKGLCKISNDERFAYDSYRRFIQMFGDVVMEVEHAKFEHVLESVKSSRGITEDVLLTVDDLKRIVTLYKEIIHQEKGESFPQDPMQQLWQSVNAVFNSWNNDRAIRYRKLNNITGLLGTAVNIQAMVFGNLGDDSGTGVCFSRNPSTGVNEFYGEYLMKAQGEDVVAGIRTPIPISELAKEKPVLYKELIHYKDVLEKHFKDMQDMEFTIQQDKLYILQTRRGKRTAFAELKIVVDMVNEGLINKKTAILRVVPEQLVQLLHPNIDPSEKYQVIGRGLPASPGAAVGKIVFTAEIAEQQAAQGEKVILVRKETSPEDIGGMHAAQGILTATGGMTSHAAVVARGMGKCCVAGCRDLVLKSANSCEIGGRLFKEGDIITLNGSKGEVIPGEIILKNPEISGDFEEFLRWVDEVRVMKVRTNADTPKDTAVARKFGAEGIGLCRTEHMFFEGQRIDAMREMILADDKAGRQKALAKILPMQMEDFVGIFRAIEGYPVTIRLLDPPLHEFLPHTDAELEELSKIMGVDALTLKEKTQSLKEFNPMLGHRGCRLAITYPEIAEIQTEAILRAALLVKKEGHRVEPEIMIPITSTEQEFRFMKKIIDSKAQEVFQKEGDSIPYKVGTMIEIPRACMVADKIAQEAEFFSFGTNDLTQMSFGFSRDDINSFLPDYLAKEILPEDPFQVLDTQGVGQLMEIAIKKGRQTRPNLKIGICGEHGGEPRSVEFCFGLGLNYVSCSPYRVPVARLAAAQASIKKEK